MPCTKFVYCFFNTMTITGHLPLFRYQQFRHTAFPIPVGPYINHSLQGPKRLLVPSDLESQAFWKSSPRLSTVMKRAEKTWSTSAVLVPLNYRRETLPRIIDNHFFICGVSSLRVSEGLGPIRNIEPGIFYFSSNSFD